MDQEHDWLGRSKSRNSSCESDFRVLLCQALCFLTKIMSTCICWPFDKIYTHTFLYSNI